MSKLYQAHHSSPLLRFLTPEDVSHLFDKTEVYKFSRGEHIIFDRDSEAIMFLIELGRVEVVAKQGGQTAQLAILEQGDIVGELSYLTGERRTADVVALEDATIRFMEPERINPLLQQDSGLAARFFYSLAHILAGRVNVENQKSFSAETKGSSLARLHIWVPAATWARGQLFHPAQKIKEVDGGVEISFPFSGGSPALARQLLSLGPDCQVLAPDSLRDEVASLARKIVSTYEF